MKASKFTKHEDLVLDFTKMFPDVPPEEATLNLTVNPAVLTPHAEAQLQEKGEKMEILVDVLAGGEDSAPLVVKWDLLDDDGTPVPITREALMHQPIVLLAPIVQKVGEALANKTNEEGKVSVAT